MTTNTHTQAKRIRTEDGHSIYGMLIGKLSDPLVVIVHGLPGTMDDSLYVEAGRWFVKRGYAVFRFNFYGYQSDARQLMECNLGTHASDLDAAVAYFRKRNTKTVFIVDHSFGGPTIFSSHKQDFDGVALWDPSYGLSFLKPMRGVMTPAFIKSLGAYVTNWGWNLVISKKMVDGLEAFPWKTASRDFHPSFKIIVAGSGKLGAAKNYLKSSRPGNEMKIIKGADHDFGDSASQEALFKETDRWFQKVLTKK